MKWTKQLLLCLVSCALILVSCQTIDLFEKSVAIPGHAWKSSFRPTFTFTIKDTASPYDVFLVLRHNDKYSFNNIYVNIHAHTPDDSVSVVRYDLALGTDEKGWLATGMDDIYEHRIALTSPDHPSFFRMPGVYTFGVEQLMREDPLTNVLNVGLRIEKKK